MAITTSNSINVKPERFEIEFFFMAKYDANLGDHVALALRELLGFKRKADEITSKFGVPPNGTAFEYCLLLSCYGL